MIKTDELQLLNMRKSEAARRDICRGIALGVNPFRLLMIAIKCIAELSGDSSFSSMCSRSIEDIYGAGLNNTEYNAHRASELEESIMQLNDSLQACTAQGTRERLQFALRLQKKELETLKKQVKKV
ncbi:MAG: hypothetical protein ACI4JK_04920 [Oscillospiraceae bacterium]